MEVLDAIASLKPAKKFRKQEVEENMVGVMLNMASHALSAGNVQEWNYIVVKSAEQKKKLFEAALSQTQIRDAPVVVAVCADLGKISLKYGKRGEIVYSVQDAAAAATLLMLAAKGLGLGSDWFRAFDEERVKQILLLPENIRPMALVAVGYVEEEEDLKKVPFENLTFVDTFNKKYDIAYMTQPGKHVTVEMKAPGDYANDAFRRLREEQKTKEPILVRLLRKLKGK